MMNGVNYRTNTVERPTIDTVSAAVAELARERVGSRSVIARRMGVSVQYVSRLLNGWDNITPSSLNKLLDAVGVTDEERAVSNAWAAREAGWRF